jgi:acetamidase/formamidase
VRSDRLQHGQNGLEKSIMKFLLATGAALVLVVSAISAARAQIGMSSANYRIPTSVINSGGGTASSTNYTLIASIGEPVIGLIGTTPPDNYKLNAGFLATLIQVIGSPGDLNYDGLVDINDVKLALQIAAGLASGAYPGVNFPSGDVVPAVPDGKIDLRDADRILRFVRGTDLVLP